MPAWRRTAPARLKTRRLPTPRWPPAPARSSPARPAARIGRPSTTNCIGSKRPWDRWHGTAGRPPSNSFPDRTRSLMFKVVLLRHGESTWNQENRFTGWTDVDLSAKGLTEAKAAGVLLRESGYVFDIAYTSVLK